MIDAINLNFQPPNFAKAVSWQPEVYNAEPIQAAEAAQPALKRRNSNLVLPIKIQIPKLALEPADQNAIVLIDTGDVVEEEPAFQFCGKQKSCGHACMGVAGERNCLPCIDPACAEASGLIAGINAEELCTICYTTSLGEEPCSKLGCGHVYHTRCVVDLLKHKWATLRITFAFMSCPNCKQEIELKGVSRPIAQALGPLKHLKSVVERETMINADKQGILEDDRLKNKQDAYYKKPLEYAMHRCSFYQCHSCQKPYFGGLIDCEQEMANAEKRDTKKEDLLCQECLLKEIGAGTTSCEKHGTEQIDWKCMYCCSTALFCCFGTHYMCNPCHDEYNRSMNPPTKDCNGIDCPLGIAHPPPNKDPTKGGVYPLGCGICRSERLEMLQNRDIQQVVSSDNLPEAMVGLYNGKRRDQKIDNIDRPKVEIEMPDFIALADEILEQEIAAEKERIRILNKTPVPFYTKAQLAKQKKIALKKARVIDLPDWFLNPLGEDEDEEVKEVADDKDNQEMVEGAAAQQAIKDENQAQAQLAAAKAKTLHMQQRALKVICGMAPKRARVMRKRR